MLFVATAVTFLLTTVTLLDFTGAVLVDVIDFTTFDVTNLIGEAVLIVLEELVLAEALFDTDVVFFDNDSDVFDGVTCLFNAVVLLVLIVVVTLFLTVGVICFFNTEETVFVFTALVFTVFVGVTVFFSAAAFSFVTSCGDDNVLAVGEKIVS